MERTKRAPGISSVMQGLATYISRAPRKALPRPVLEKTKHHVLDAIAAMVSGSRLPPGRMAISYVNAVGGNREATVAGTKAVTSAINAAFANGMFAHADETDDTHAPSSTHPGSSVVTAALAMAEREQRDGMALLRAVTLGYDVSTRLSLSLVPAEFRNVGHSGHGFGPMFGAAAAAAALARFKAEQVRYALSYAAQQASGLSCYTRDQHHIEKAFDCAGMPARNGVAAVIMVAAGGTGVDDVFSGERNFFKAFDESRRISKPPDPDMLVRDLGKRYEIMNTGIKRWSVGLPIQAPLDTLLDLVGSESTRADDVEKLVVRVSTTGANVTDNSEMSDICMQHMCALMLVDGMVTFETAHDAKRMKDPKVLALRRRVEVVADEELDEVLPIRHSIVELTLKDGRQIRRHNKAARGTAQNPMTRAELDEKCYHLMAPVLGKKRARTLCDTVWHLERTKDVRRLRPLLQS